MVQDGPGQLVNHICVGSSVRWVEWTPEQPDPEDKTVSPFGIIPCHEMINVVRTTSLTLFKTERDQPIQANAPIRTDYFKTNPKQCTYKDRCPTHNPDFNEEGIVIPPRTTRTGKSY